VERNITFSQSVFMHLYLTVTINAVTSRCSIKTAEQIAPAFGTGFLGLSHTALCENFGMSKIT